MGLTVDPFVSAGIGFAVGIVLGFALRGKMRSFPFVQSRIPKAILTKERFSTSNASSTSQTAEGTAQARADRAMNRSFGGRKF